MGNNMIPIAKPLIGEEEKTAVMQVLSSGMLASGPKTQEFEKKFAEYVGTKHAVATCSGTTALHLCLRTGRFLTGWIKVLTISVFISRWVCRKWCVPI